MKDFALPLGIPPSLSGWVAMRRSMQLPTDTYLAICLVTRPSHPQSLLED